MSGGKTHIRASERTARPRADGRAIDVEIVHTAKLLRDLQQGMRNLRNIRPEPSDLERRVIEQAAKIRRVEAKLFRLRQGRLL